MGRIMALAPRPHHALPLVLARALARRPGRVPALAAALALPACEDELRRSRFAHLVSALLAANIPVPMDLLSVYEDDFNAYWNA